MATATARGGSSEEEASASFRSPMMGSSDLAGWGSEHDDQVDPVAEELRAQAERPMSAREDPAEAATRYVTLRIHPAREDPSSPRGSMTAFPPCETHA